jgi:hypothetical protein
MTGISAAMTAFPIRSRHADGLVPSISDQVDKLVKNVYRKVISLCDLVIQDPHWLSLVFNHTASRHAHALLYARSNVLKVAPELGTVPNIRFFFTSAPSCAPSSRDRRSRAS